METTRPETWKPIPFAPGYDVSDLGRVRSWRKQARGGGIGATSRILSPRKDGKGYWLVTLSIGCKSRSVGVHRLIATAFIGGQPVGKPEVLHNDGNPLNNSPRNLRWGTHAENMADMVLHGRSSIGARNGSAKLTPSLVERIFILRSNRLSHKAIALEVGVGPLQVSRVLSGKSWKNQTVEMLTGA